MTEDEALALSGYLIGATTGWNDQSAEVLVREMRKWTDLAAAQETISQFVQNWTERTRPTLGQIITLYRATMARKSPPPPALDEGFVAPSVGIQIALRTYRENGREYGAAPDVDPERAEAAIIGSDLPVGDCWLSRYVDVVRAFNGHHPSARASLEQLEKSGRLLWRNDGRLALCNE